MLILNRPILLIIAVAMLLGGCSAAGQPQVPGTKPAQPDPKPQPAPPAITLVASVSVPAAKSVLEASVSPDGRWLAYVASEQGKDSEVVLVPHDRNTPSVVFTADSRLLQAGTLLLRGLGFTADSARYIFARQGTQPDGAHKGQRGVSLRAVDLNTNSVSEIGWLPVKSGNYVNNYYFLPEGAVLVYAGDTVWRLDTGGQKPKPVITGLAGNFGPHDPVLSPDGKYLAYPRLGDKPGLYVVSTSGGPEVAIAPRGDTMSFYPSWSPDSKHIAYYTAKRLEGSGIHAQYDVISYEDGPFSAGTWIDVSSRDGKHVARYEIAGAKLAHKEWANSGERLGFFSVREKRRAQDVHQADMLEWQSVYSATLDGKVTRIADVPSNTADRAFILRLAANGLEAHVLTYERDSWTLHMLSTAAMTKVKMPDGRDGRIEPFPVMEASDSSFIACLDSGGSQNLMAVKGAASEILASGAGDSYIIGVSQNHIVYLSRQPSGKSQVMVFGVRAASGQ